MSRPRPYPDLVPTRDANGHVCIEYFAEVQRRNSEAASAQGEVRMVARLETDAARTVYLDGVAEERGKDVAIELRRRVWEYMKWHGLAPEPQQEGLFA